MNRTTPMRTKAKTILLFLLCMPLFRGQAFAAEDENDALPYPPRTFIYIMDYSGSMSPLRTAIEAGRDMLSALLPEERTKKIEFAETVLTPADRFDTPHETSVLSGLRKADLALDDLWDTDPNQRVTVLLFSDMHNTVRVEDGHTPLTQTYFDEVEKPKLKELEEKWGEYVRDGKLYFYTIPWLSQLQDEGFTYLFDPAHTAPTTISGDSLPNSQEEILKACVEAYARVLTGRGDFEWEDLPTVHADAGCGIQLVESYRTFLFCEQSPSSVMSDYTTFEPKSWSLSSGASVWLLEHTQNGTYLLTDLPEDVKVSALVIPQPRITVDISPTDPMCMENKVSIKVGVKAGREYLDYDDGNGSCMVQVFTPSGESEALTAEYGTGQNYYEFSYMPQVKGSHKISVLYTSGSEIRSVSEQMNVSAFRIILKGQVRRDYSELRDNLQRLEKGQTFDVRLADYYSTPYRGVEFVVESAEANGAATWDALSDEIGKITIEARRKGSTTLRYTVNYYDMELGTLDNSVDYFLRIEVQNAKPNIWLIIAGIINAAILAVFIIYRVRVKRHKT